MYYKVQKGTLKMQEFTTIRVSKEIRDELSLYGSKQESFESILSKIIREKKSHSSPEHKIPPQANEVLIDPQ